MSLPDFVFAKAFWQMVSFILAGVLGLLVFFGVLDPKYALSAGSVLSLLLAVLKWFDIEPQVRARIMARQALVKKVSKK